MATAKRAKVTPVKTKAQGVYLDRQKAAVEKSSKMTAETVLKNFTVLKLGMTDSMDQISNKLANAVAELKEVNGAIEAQKAELAALHDIKVEAESLQNLKDSQEATKLDFSASMEDIRNKWASEDLKRQEWWQETNEKAHKERTREKEEYQYNFEKQRREAQDELNAELGEARQEQANWIAGQDQLIKQRAEAVSIRENFVADLEARVKAVEIEKENEVKKQVAIATSSLKKDLEHGFALERAGFRNDLAGLQIQLKSRDERISDLVSRVTDLTTQLKETTTKVQAIAVTAIEGASKQTTSIHIPTPEPTGKR